MKKQLKKKVLVVLLLILVSGGIAIAYSNPCVHCSAVDAYPLQCDVCGNIDDVYHFHLDKNDRDAYHAVCRYCGNSWEGVIEKPKY